MVTESHDKQNKNLKKSKIETNSTERNDMKLKNMKNTFSYRKAQFFSPDHFSEGLAVLLITPPGTEEKYFSRIFALPMDADAPPEAVALTQMALSQ